jgi:putative toxin-antitoxin system antitoxin component (TIGR02293 family)
MAEMAKIRKYRTPKTPLPQVEDAAAPYFAQKRSVTVAEYPYRKLKKIADKVPFTQAEWAQMLHLSERTLQRYAKNNTVFDGIYTDRILLLEQMINTGLDTFTDAASFYDWLKKDKEVMGQTLGFNSLYTDRGIQEITDQLHRIQYGIYT